MANKDEAAELIVERATDFRMALSIPLDNPFGAPGSAEGNHLVEGDLVEPFGPNHRKKLPPPRGTRYQEL